MMATPVSESLTRGTPAAPPSTPPAPQAPAPPLSSPCWLESCFTSRPTWRRILGCAFFRFLREKDFEFFFLHLERNHNVSTDVSSELSGAPDFCLSLTHGSCLLRVVGMGCGEGASEIPATSFRDPDSPFLPLHVVSTWGGGGIL